MPEFLTPALLVDIAIAWMVIEALVIGAGYLRHGRHALARWSVANAAAGLMLLLAVRVAVTGGSALALALCLGGALGAHLLEMAWRGALRAPGRR